MSSRLMNSRRELHLAQPPSRMHAMPQSVSSAHRTGQTFHQQVTFHINLMQQCLYLHIEAPTPCPSLRRSTVSAHRWLSLRLKDAFAVSPTVPQEASGLKSSNNNSKVQASQAPRGIVVSIANHRCALRCITCMSAAASPIVSNTSLCHSKIITII